MIERRRLRRIGNLIKSESSGKEEDDVKQREEKERGHDKRHRSVSLFDD